MGIATQLLPSVALQHSKGHHSIPLSEDKYNYSLNSMSQDYHQQGIFSFSSNGFERSQQHQQQRQQQQILHHQIRRDKHRVEGFEPPPPNPVALEEDGSAGLPGYDNAGILSEMFSFSSGTTTATELLESQIQANYIASRQLSATGGGGSDWYGRRQPGMMAVGGLGPSSDHSKDQNFVNERDSIATAAASVHRQQQQQISSINGDSAAAMHLFLMNPQPKSPSPSPTARPASTSSTLHMLLPNTSTATTLHGFDTTVATPSQVTPAGGAAAAFGGPCYQFTWFPDGTHEGNLNTAAQLNNPNEIGGLVEGQGLSLSLASSLQHIDATKAEELGMGDGGILFFNQGGGPTTPAQYQYKNLLQSGLVQNQQVHVGFGSSSGMANLLRNSKYSKAAQELLEEFCSVGRGQFKNGKFGKNNTNPNFNPSGSRGGSGGVSSSSSKDPPTSLSAADRLEHQRRKLKLLSMLDEVDRRYSHYCEQLQMVVNSYDLVMGFEAAIPYTALAQKAMSRHFRCLKDAIASQLKQSCELLGEKDASTSGVTKGDTPRLKMLEQSLRQHKAFHQMGMMEQEAWRPQRGLPERSVNILRAWLFEHFLNPYPSDADKHLLARQTELSRNQVSNWFINARVRLWKPMIEEMYEQEIKEEAVKTTRDREKSQNSDPAQASTPPRAAAAAPIATAKRSKMNASESDPSLIAINTQCFSENQANNTTSSTIMSTPIMPTFISTAAAASQQQFPDMGSKLIRFGTIAGDVSLTLGLRHAGNLQPEKSSFSVRDFGSC